MLLLPQNRNYYKLSRLIHINIKTWLILMIIGECRHCHAHINGEHIVNGNRQGNNVCQRQIFLHAIGDMNTISLLVNKYINICILHIYIYIYIYEKGRPAVWRSYTGRSHQYISTKYLAHCDMRLSPLGHPGSRTLSGLIAGIKINIGSRCIINYQLK